MTLIFISHSSKDGDLAIALMDLLQNQFNLHRENFFLTSDEELKVGEDWIESIRKGMEQANIVLPLITPNFLESQFCLCELGATWINQKALVPVIIPPLKHNALQNTPFSSWLQNLILNSEEDIVRLAQAMIDRGVGTVNIPRFTKRANTFYKSYLEPFKVAMQNRVVISATTVEKLQKDIEQYKEAYELAEEELDRLKEENEALRQMKNKKEIKEYDYSKMDEWDRFEEKSNKVAAIISKLPHVLPSVLFHAYRYDARKSDERGLYSPSANDELKKLENRGFVKFEDGWEPNEEHPQIRKINEEIWEFKKFLDENITEKLEGRFYEEYEGIIFDLAYSDFWEEIFGVTIYHSGE
ncbi:hypothetical protein CD30_05900 [Ureibacillus massiliensis 4400831 = CIP 108448 = CCUG 49529]|uniref:TIR domain-containing protein n=1 Tax=Ureibacillus massiliensis 4400831 = CIP 108448 = CCUG 49529 TaxID=1211035 RepID=A0A0A3J2W9_9BACL|nr:toll/interleukin-1 receptor domain-containing protein [Ureibacillus massiliensis]KGR91349.1 hypothetical protein CD30_05900 [Ureibacillus massiliensis 4400831 = CIP 108448 = CCUG 49529]